MILPRIAGSHCDHAAALALAVYRHDRYGLGNGNATIDWERSSERGTPFGDASPLAYGARM